ncbi:MAG: TIGR03936 family radical SAM-associated protein [Oscillospiraceae bacterium]|jgi:radical SAM-linked protein|nr:TIGR03936 family radical SAM-associated protein [Oscillospiraceae bacterium]
MQEVTFPVRLFYSRTGRARYISHLDTMRAMTRAFRRSGLPFWYTQGFNPHLYLTFLLPLALGVESLCEMVDFRFTKEIGLGEAERILAECLPPGFSDVRAARPVLGAGDIAFSEYDIFLGYPESVREAAARALESLFDRPAIEVVKKTKKGERPIDIKPHMTLIGRQTTGDGLSLRLRLAAGSDFSVSPKLPLEALYADAGEPERVRIIRARVLDSQLRDFE